MLEFVKLEEVRRWGLAFLQVFFYPWSHGRCRIPYDSRVLGHFWWYGSIWRARLLNWFRSRNSINLAGHPPSYPLCVVGIIVEVFWSTSSQHLSTTWWFGEWGDLSEEATFMWLMTVSGLLESNRHCLQILGGNASSPALMLSLDHQSSRSLLFIHPDVSTLNARVATGQSATTDVVSPTRVSFSCARISFSLTLCSPTCIHLENALHVGLVYKRTLKLSNWGTITLSIVPQPGRLSNLNTVTSTSLTT